MRLCNVIVAPLSGSRSLLLRELSNGESDLHQPPCLCFERITVSDGKIRRSVEGPQSFRQRRKLIPAAIDNDLETGKVLHQAARSNDLDQQRLPLGNLLGPCDVVARKLAVHIPTPKNLLGHGIRPLTWTQLELTLAIQLDQFIDHGQRGGVARGDQLGPDTKPVNRRTRGHDPSDFVLVQVAREHDLDRRPPELIEEGRPPLTGSPCPHCRSGSP